MSKEKKGVACAGNWIIDHLKVVGFYPSECTLTNILSETIGGGGGAYNVIINLAKFDSAIPLFAYGVIGDDSDAEYIIKECTQYKNINISGLFKTDQDHTSYTDVFNVKETSKRTFFHNRGANKLFGQDKVDVNLLSAKIFYLGYLLLLDAMDITDSKYGTKASRLLYDIQKKDIKTAVDLVSEDSDRFIKIVPPALKYTNYCVINDFESEKLSGIPLRDGNKILKANLKKIAKSIFKYGVNDLVVIHFPEGAYLQAKNGTELYQPSLDIPKNMIAGTTGAGDSFCSGIIYGLYSGWDYEKTLQFAVCAGAKNLFHISTTGAITNWKEIFKMKDQFPFIKD